MRKGVCNRPGGAVFKNEGTRLKVNSLLVDSLNKQYRQMRLSKFINIISWPINFLRYKSFNGINSRKEFYKVIVLRIYEFCEVKTQLEFLIFLKLTKYQI